MLDVMSAMEIEKWSKARESGWGGRTEEKI